MNQPLRFVSVKLSPVGRAQAVVCEQDGARAWPRPGDSVVVQTEAGAAMATVVAAPSRLMERRQQNGALTGRIVRLA